MNLVGRKIYFELSTGNIIQDTGERAGDVVETTKEQDFAMYAALSERVPDNVGVMQLEYGQYAQDFAACNGYKINVSGETPSLLFSFPDPSEPQAPQLFRPMLSVKVAEQDHRIADLELALADLFTGGM